RNGMIQTYTQHNIKHSYLIYVFRSSRRRHTRLSRDWSSDVCSSDLVRELRRGVSWEHRALTVGRVAARAACVQRRERARALVAVAALAVDLEVHAGQREAGARVRLEAGHVRERRRVVAARAVGGEAALVHIDVTAPAVVGRELRLVEAQVQVARAARRLRVPAEQPEARVHVVAEL